MHHLSVLSVLCEPSGSTSLCVPSVAHLHSTSSVWGLPHQSQSHLNPLHSPPTSHYSNKSSMHLTTSRLAPPLQQPKLVCHLGLSKHWDAGEASASPSISELHLLSFRRFLGCWPHHALQDRGYGTRYQDIAPVVFYNHLVMLAVFGIFFGCIPATFTCM